MSTADNSLPLMHTHYLSLPQRTYCERNATYAASLACVKKLQQRVCEMQAQLGASKDDPELTADALSKWKEKINVTEELFMADDDELASLAEALLAKKRFKTEDELTKIDGRWYWALPQGFGCEPYPKSLSQRIIHAFTKAHFGRWYTIENANSVEVGKC
ncbi:hypothetical protein D0859_16378 [Hortaea werneckii]|uniref:Uncharacterized protein n=1 Tax=Hortaea werneckii TaxID=91943 RepID=A0A3M7I251_HORWE|nr:hypothetical protein D0859_16378 [Hortaea werneckii]